MNRLVLTRLAALALGGLTVLALTPPVRAAAPTLETATFVPECSCRGRSASRGRCCGYTTRYYHLWDYGQFDGQTVSAGQFLGHTGTETGCGGAASSRHVHFSLLQNGNYVALARHVIGKWLPMEGAANYQGYALHGSTRVNVGGLLHNYGALGFTQGIVDANGGTTVNKRSGPGTGHPVVGSVQDGVTVNVACSANGTTHTGRWGTTSLWNRLTDGSWVSDAFLYTGVAEPVNGWCGGQVQLS